MPEAEGVGLLGSGLVIAPFERVEDWRASLGVHEISDVQREHEFVARGKPGADKLY